MDITIEYPGTDSDDALHPVHHHYAGQIDLQPAYVEMDEDGAVTLDVDSEIGSGMPVNVWTNRTLRWRVDARLTALELRTLLDEIKPLLQEIHDGQDVQWDGGNQRGKLTDAASAASDTIESICFERMTESGGVQDAGDWWSGDPPDVAMTATDAELAEMVTDAESMARLDGVTLTDALGYLQGLRSDAEEDA